MKKKIITVTLIIIGGFVLCETYLRIFEHETLKKFKRDLAYIPDTLYGFRYRKNKTYDFIWPNISKTVKFNNQGFYGPDFSETKKDNYFRIIFVGKSNTLGIRTEGSENFVMKLQNLFKQENYNVEVINCSVDGTDRDIGI